MRFSRAKFKYLLRKCRREEATIRADILASDLSNNDSTLFWKHVSKQNNGSLKLADTVGGATGHVDIASMWNDHYSQLFNCVKGDTHKSDVLDANNLVSGDCDMFNQNDVKSAIASLCVNKACGMDSLLAKHLLYASPEIHTMLAVCFNAFIVHGCLPSSLTDSVIIPIVKDKCKNISDIGNYRHIALSSVLSKVFELILLSKLNSYFCTTDYQFGFKSNHSTDLCIYTLKEVIDFYHSQSTSIYMCFMDASKAFDRVNHWTLFKKLIDRGTPLIFVRIIMQWYTTQKACVRWGSALSDNFLITNGVRQGGILSPLFFNVYMDCLSESLCNTQTGYNVGGVMINHLMYADDLVIISPSAKGLQRLVDICAVYGQIHDILFNQDKTVCMYMPSGNHYYLNTPVVILNGIQLAFVRTYTYLGTVMTCDNADDANMRRQRGICYARANGIIKNCSMCSPVVKATLFRTFCSNMYCSQLWRDFKSCSIRKLIVGYNHSFRYIMNYHRNCSASGMFVFNSIPSFMELWRNYIYGFMQRLNNSDNTVVAATVSSCRLSSAMWRRWESILYTKTSCLQ